MGGALGLGTGLLQGQYLINIDTEEWGEFYMGCAGGVDVNVSRAYASEALPAGYQAASLVIRACAAVIPAPTFIWAAAAPTRS